MPANAQNRGSACDIFRSMTAQRVLDQRQGITLDRSTLSSWVGPPPAACVAERPHHQGVPRGRSAHGGLAGAINGRRRGPSDRPVSGTTGRYKSH
jgi:hypothetical protein